MNIKKTPSLNPIAFDVTKVALRSARNFVRMSVHKSGFHWEESDDFWARFMEPLSTNPCPTMVIADLANIARQYQASTFHRWIASVRMNRPYFIALIRTRTDEEYAHIIDELVRHSDLRISVCKSQKEPDLLKCMFEAANILSSGGISDVRYLSGSDCLWVMFGDGVSGLIQWRDLDLIEIRKNLILESTTSGEFGASIEILTKDGALFEIDADLIKAILSKRHANLISQQGQSEDIEVGSRIKVRRSEAGLSQSALGKRINIDQAIISKIERGLHQPRVDTLRRIASGLNLDLIALLTREGTTCPVPSPRLRRTSP